MLVFLLGIKAVGKSRLVSELNTNLAKPIKEISYGDAMLEIAKEAGVKDREDMAKLPPAKQNEIREKAAKKIRAIADKEKLVFLNTHGFIYTIPHHTYLPGSPDSVSDMLRPQLVLLVEAAPDAIIARRSKDLQAGRKREIGTKEEIRTALELERMSAVHLSCRYGIDLKPFDNSRDISQARAEVAALAALLKTYL